MKSNQASSQLYDRVRILISAPLDQAYTYLSPKNIKISRGDFVIVPLGKRKVAGVVWDFEDGVDNTSVSELKLKTILKHIDLS